LVSDIQVVVPLVLVRQEHLEIVVVLGTYSFICQGTSTRTFSVFESSCHLLVLLPV